MHTAHKLTNTVTQRAQSATGTFYPVTLTGPDLRGGAKRAVAQGPPQLKGFHKKQPKNIT